MKIDRIDVLLDLIRDAATNALSYVDGVTIEEFQSDSKTRHAVAMCLLIIGENVARLAKYHPEFVAAHPETPWKGSIGMRNRIAHGYDDLDFGVVWRTATLDIPQLLRELPASKPL